MTTFTKDGLVQKLPKTSSSFYFAGFEVKWEPKDQHLIDDSSLIFTLKKNAYFGTLPACEEIWFSFLSWSLRHWENGDTLQGLAIDATLGNAFAKGNSFELIDVEWNLLPGVPRSWFILRNVLSLFHTRVPGFPKSSLADLYQTTCEKFQITPNLSSDLVLEAKFQTAVSESTTVERELVSLKKALDSVPSSFPRSPLDLSLEASELDHLRRENERLKALLGSGIVKAWEKARSGLKEFPLLHNTLKKSLSLFFPAWRSEKGTS